MKNPTSPCFLGSAPRRSFHKKFMRACAGFLLLAVLPLVAVGDELVELTGRFEIRATNCFSEDAGDHSHTELLLLDETTYEHTRLTGDKKVLSRLKPDQLVRIRGYRVDPAGANGGSDTALKATPLEGGLESELAVETFEVLEEPEDGFGDIRAFGSGNEKASGANDLHMLTCLLVFASSTDFPSATVESNALGLLFDNPTNANEAMQAVTKGRYGLQLGNGSAENPIVHLQLDVSSSGRDSDDMETLMLTALSAAGYNRFDYNRVLFFPPDGIKSFTAFGYFGSSDTPGNGRRTVYGKSYGNDRMNGYIHEFGHNFGFHHSRKGSNEYGDRTCVMGLSRDETKTETYSGVKLLETNWLDVFPGSKLEVTQDVTLDLYPLSSDPNLLSEVITVAISGTPYVVGYHIDDRPYGFLSQSGDRERLFVYRREEEPVSEFRPFSYQEANLGPGEEFSGPGVITFDRHGPNNEYATVSIDIDDGNAKPEATAQSLFTDRDAPLVFTLQGTDADADPLTYTIIEGPSSGSLSGTAPNLTYTPNGGFEGDDVLLFSVNDGLISSFAAVDIRVETNNFEPEVDAGGDQTVTLEDGVAPPATLGASILLDARLDDGANSIWEDEMTLWPLPLDASVNFIENAGSALPGITASYDFPGGLSGAGGGEGPGLRDLNVNTQPFTLEIWFKPDTSESYPANGQVLYETGGGTGLGLFYRDGVVEAAHDGNAIRISSDVSGLTGDFIQAVLSYDTRSATNNFNLSINGVLQATGSRDDGDISGSDGAGLGQRGSSNVGGAGNGDANTESFDGKIALFRTYHDRILTGPEIQTNYNSIAGGSAVSVALTGSVTDQDGGTPPRTTWTKVSGPGTVFFNDGSEVDTTATITETGTYVLRLTVDDGAFQSFDEITVIVNEPNSFANAGPDQIITDVDRLGSVDVTLDGSASTAREGRSIVSYEWSDGVGEVATGATPTIALDVGSYSLTLTITDDNADTYTDSVSVIVNAPPLVDAGADQTAVISGDALWTPAQLATTAWYDASDTGTITENAGAVSQWADKSGNGLHLTQASSVAQPISGTASINGDNAIQFDGSDDTLATSSNPFAPTVEDALVIAVHKVGATGSDQTLFTLSGSGAQSGRWQAHAPWGGTVYFDTGGASGSNRVATSYAASGGDDVLVGFYGSTTEGLQQIFKNGALLAGDSSGHSVGTAGNIYIGSDGNSQYQDTSIGEVVIIEGTVSVEDRQKLEGYLAHEWGLAASLPTAHPYAAAPPGGAGASVVLNGMVTDEDGGTPATTWSQVSGPGTVAFSDPSAVDTTATITEAGVYVLRLTADDGIFETFDEVTITIPENLEEVDVVATDNAYAREGAPVEDASSELLIKKDTWSSTARWAYLRFPLSGDAAIGGVDAAGIAQASLFVNATRHITGDTFVVYALQDGADDPTTTLSETSWTGGTDGTEAGGNNLQGSSRPDGENNLPNAFSTTALGSFTFASSGDDTDLGIKEIAISDLPAFRQLLEDDQNGEITLIITGTVGGSGSGITSLFAGTPALAPRLVIERELAPIAPLAPADLIATGGNASVSLSWTDNSDNETGFIVQRSDTPGGPFIEISTTAADLASYVDSGLDAGSTFYYEVVATNAAGDSAPAPEVSATTFTASEAWRDQYFAQIENSGDAADGFDFDGDGLSNLLERAFGTLPTDSNSRVAMPQGNVVEIAGADYLSISYRRRIGGVGVTGDGYTADGLTYRVEYDADLTDPWSSGSVVVVGPTVDNGNGTESVTVRLNTPVDGVDNQFIRLSVTSAP